MMLTQISQSWKIQSWRHGSSSLSNSCTGCWPFGRLYHNNQVLCSPYPQSDAETGKPLVFPPLDRPEDIFSEFGSS
ncbi:hypothetical protein, partial [Bifidobacterium pullorum]|uniref:hypothetical protein n=1 Tax=Bifidobacterium pullorum TaxID=78448 RepID=UPI003AF152A1